MLKGISGMRMTSALLRYRLECDPSGVSSHDLQNDHTLVALSRSVEFIKRVRCGVNGCLKTEGHVGGHEIVVNGLGNADHGNAELVDPVTDLEGAVTAITIRASIPSSLMLLRTSATCPPRSPCR